MFPFVLPPFDSSRTASDVSWMNDAPAGRHGFVSARGEHFVDGRGRHLRLWGVNINFAGVFPPKDQAPRIAARLAKFGFNAVRIHHFEGYAAPSGLWKTAATGSSRLLLPRQVDPEQMDRFDFFASELIKKGIYININLHVGRKVMDGEGVPSPHLLPEKDKGINYYEPRLRVLQDDFSRLILTHVNPYTGRSYANEPGVCAVEVANENSLLGMWLDGDLASVGPEHLQVLGERWNAWLRGRYSEVSLRRAWTEINEPLQPTNLLAGPLPFEVVNLDAPDAKASIAAGVLENNFQLATVTGAQGTLSFDRVSGPTVDGFVRPGLTADLTQAGTVAWAFQVNRDGLDLQEGHPYTLSFWARADLPRSVSVNLWQDRAPRRFGGFTGHAALSRDWQRFSFTFRPVNPDPGHMRLAWNLGNAQGRVQMGEIELREGGAIAAPDSWNLERGVPVLDFKSTQVLVARRDFAEFLSSVEAEHVKASRQFLKDLGVRVPIWHTQVQFGGWGGLAREADSDAFDVHAYWKHPDFSGTAWNASSWKVENQSMVQSSGVDPLSAFALLRAKGKPFVMSEWNSGQPNDFGGESLLMAAAYAAWQDWAAVWLFDYHSAGPYDRDRIEGFFSIDSHPVKMATAPAAALLYRRPPAPSALPSVSPGDVQVALEEFTLQLPRDGVWLEVASAPGPPTAAPIVKTWTQAGAPRTVPLRGKAYASLGGGVFPTASVSSWDDESRWSSDTGQMRWDRGVGLWTLDSPASKSAVGFLGGRRVDVGEWSVEVPRTEAGFAALSLASLDGKPSASSGRLLLTAVGRVENVGMVYNAARNSVGTQWGLGPTHVEGIHGAFQLACERPGLRVYALDETGARKGTVPSAWKNGVLSFSISPEWRALWYEIADPVS
jgi:hypothetical protein